MQPGGRDWQCLSHHCLFLQASVKILSSVLRPPHTAQTQTNSQLPLSDHSVASCPQYCVCSALAQVAISGWCWCIKKTLDERFMHVKTELKYFRQNSCILNMQQGITKWTQINPSWTDMITTSLVPVLQNMKTGNDGTECLEKQSAHSIPPSHTPRWFASTPPIRESNGSDSWQPSSSDFACWIGADDVHVAPKASNAAEHIKQKCSRSRPSLSKRFRRPTVGPVCSCLCWYQFCVIYL